MGVQKDIIKSYFYLTLTKKWNVKHIVFNFFISANIYLYGKNGFAEAKVTDLGIDL